MAKSCRTYFGSIAVIKRVFDHQSLEHLDGNLTNLSGLLKCTTHLPEQQSHQEVVSTEVISQQVVQLEICSRHLLAGQGKSKKDAMYRWSQCKLWVFSYPGTSVFSLSKKAWADLKVHSARGCRPPAGTQTWIHIRSIRTIRECTF